MNALKAQLAPYTMLVKVGAAVLVGCVLFVGGCNYGKSNQAATVVSLQSRLDTAHAANEKYEKLEEERSRLAKLAAEETGRQEKAALAAADKARKEREHQETIEARNERARQTAIRDPKCAELMEMMVCSVVPLP